MESNRHKTRSLYWEQLHVDLSGHNAGTWEEFQRFVQAAWLLLLSTYDRSTESSCYFHKAGDNASPDVISLSIDNSLTLSHLTSLIRKEPISIDVHHDTKKTIIWQGSVCEARDWITQCHENAVHGTLEVFLVLSNVNSTICDTYNSDIGGSVDILFDQSQLKVQEEDAIGRVETLKKIFYELFRCPNNAVRDANFLSDHDRRRIIAWNQPTPNSPVQTTIPMAFAAKVASNPFAPAVHAWDGEFNYEELDTVSSSIATLLRVAGRSGPYDMVLFNMRKSKWALVAALAISKSGKAIIPIDPSWPKARLDQILGITKASLAVCNQETKDIIDTDTVRKIMVPSTSDVEQSRQLFLPETACDPSDLAFVLFSSGSTGTPKGMLRQHNTACTGSFAHAKAMHIDSTSRVLQFASHVFDVAMLDFFTTLLMGGCVCIPSETDRKNDLAGFVKRSKANWALLTPTVADLLDPCTVPSFKFVTLGGESINPRTLRKWLKVCRVGINYGSAEVDVTHSRDVFDEKDVSNVGQRLPSCAAYIVDPEDPAIILPVGATGELVISGPTMAREYLNAPAKTADVFMNTPQAWLTHDIVEAESPRWMSRIYRMGDLFRQKVDGSLEFISRKDFQVKVNGQKVELGDIESRLVQHPVVKHCAVIYPTHGPYAKRLVAMIQSIDPLLSRHTRAVNATKGAPTLQNITEYLSQALPPFMLPTVLVRLKNMPYTPTMKIDRNRLQNWLLENDVIQASLGEISNISTALEGPSLCPTEKQALILSALVADIVTVRHSTVWASISGHDNNLFNIGIDSAQMMRLASMIYKQFGTRIPVEVLGAKEMTVRKLAALISSNENGLDNHKATEIVQSKISFLQDRVESFSTSILNTFEGRDGAKRHVFLTGATGYLGIQILLHLLKSNNIASVTVLVRSAGADQARERITHAIVAAGASEDHHPNLHVWIGDLSKPYLGLSEEHWNELSGLGQQLENGGLMINTIIHCGAVVDWTKSYEELEPANVASTEQLLKLTMISPHVRHFIFISGGRYPDPAQDVNRDLGKMYAETAQGNGYAQTKFVAERLVDNVRRTIQDVSIDIVTPAYLIGSQERGLANQDDYLWRIIWASQRVGAFNADEQDQWLFVAEVDSVAKRVAALTQRDLTRPVSKTITIWDGLSMQDLWSNVCGVLGVSLTQESSDEWLQRVKQDMDKTSNHLLWPLADTLDNGHGHLAKGCSLARDINKGLATPGIGTAVQRNIQHLRSVGFFT